MWRISYLRLKMQVFKYIRQLILVDLELLQLNCCISGTYYGVAQIVTHPRMKTIGLSADVYHHYSDRLNLFSNKIVSKKITFAFR